MNPDEQASYRRWVEQDRARLACHVPPTSEADHAFLDALGRQLDAAPHIGDYYRQLEPPYPGPTPDADVAEVVADAIERLADQRRLPWLGHGPHQIHLIATLIVELEAQLTEAIVLAHDQELDWPDIARLAGLSLHETILQADPDPENDLDH